MSASNRNATNQKSNVPCLEVLISKSFIAENDNLFWTLSIYSLENQPVEKSRSLHNAALFHFMLFDWERTIQNLLEGNQIPYSIVQYFTPETIYRESQLHSVSGHVLASSPAFTSDRKISEGGRFNEAWSKETADSTY